MSPRYVCLSHGTKIVGADHLPKAEVGFSMSCSAPLNNDQKDLYPKDL